MKLILSCKTPKTSMYFTQQKENECKCMYVYTMNVYVTHKQVTLIVSLGFAT